jgi:hypothetical protein
VRSLSASDAVALQSELSARLSEAIRQYSSLSPDPYSDEALAGLDVTTTDACIVATALLRSQSLTPFEFAVWFASSGR